mgnify:CR=1 FL=1|jgi:hypothetical protein|tara:strand:+ start:37 stop:195 length:159 start_codon:yes stop_codon:yes gene_type:complete
MKKEIKNFAILERKQKIASFNQFGDNKITFHESYYTIEEVRQILQKAEELSK